MKYFMTFCLLGKLFDDSILNIFKYKSGEKVIPIIKNSLLKFTLHPHYNSESFRSYYIYFQFSLFKLKVNLKFLNLKSMYV